MFFSIEALTQKYAELWIGPNCPDRMECGLEVYGRIASCPWGARLFDGTFCGATVVPNPKLAPGVVLFKNTRNPDNAKLNGEIEFHLPTLAPPAFSTAAIYTNGSFIYAVTRSSSDFAAWLAPYRRVPFPACPAFTAGWNAMGIGDLRVVYVSDTHQEAWDQWCAENGFRKVDL